VPLAPAPDSAIAGDLPLASALNSAPPARISRKSVSWAAPLATAATVIYAIQLGPQENIIPGVAAVANLSLFWIAGLSKRLREDTRARIVRFVAFASSVASLTSLGLCSEYLLALFTYFALSAMHRGASAARTAFLVSLGSVGVAAWTEHTGFFTVPVPSMLDPRNPVNWVRTFLLCASMMVVAGGSALALYQHARRTAEEHSRIAAQLREEVKVRERALAQLAETQERLLHAHKLEAVGRLAGGIAHDFNNTLTVILSYGELLRARLGTGHPLADIADLITQAAEQGGDLTKQLLTFTRRQLVKPRTVDVQQILRHTERALARLVPRSVRILRSESTEDVFVKIDPTQLQQAVLNLALNARDAMPEGGELTLETRPVEIQADTKLPLLPGPYILIRVRDTGTGMTEAVQARMFEPFFTTKEPGLGTGLGLANVRETVDAAGGHVTAETALGRGSTFSIYLPQAQAHSSGVEHTVAERPVTAARVLVVDDEAQIRDVVRAILEDRGFQVRTAESTRAALSLLSTEKFDVLCTDIVMPDLSGKRLVDELRQIEPTLPVVVCSAYGSDGEVSARVQRGEVLFLAKPFTSDDLVDVVCRALARDHQGTPAQAEAGTQPRQ
jgi:signal transduction histidine kinase/CheY-like chemotaxis protein